MDQLLEAKRSEKPTSGFWEAFNDELRIKQRRLLQQQPVDDLSVEPSLWLRFRKLGTLCLATASCGAIGFMAMQSFKPRSTELAIRSDVSLDAPTTIQEANFQVATSAATEIEVKSVAEPEFFEIPAPEPSMVAQASLGQPERTTQVAAHSPVETSIEGFTLALETPFDSLQIDDSLGVDVKQSLTKRLMERYIHPLSDQGHSYEGHLASASDPLNRMSSVALKTNFFNLDTPKELKLNTLSLRF